MKCYYCKKSDHKIRTFRYKHRRDKIWSLVMSLAEKRSNEPMGQDVEASCCSVEYVATNEETYGSASVISEKPSCTKEKHDVDSPQVENNFHNSLRLKDNLVIENHHVISCLKRMNYLWTTSIWKYLSLFWICSLSWPRNLFCPKRCKRELYWLILCFGLFDLFSFFQQKDGADKSPPMVAYCTIDSPQPLRGMYKLQTSSIQTWKRKKKKKRR